MQSRTCSVRSASTPALDGAHMPTYFILYLNLSTAIAILQGAFIKRHVFLKDDGTSSFTPQDFSVGDCVTIYGRTFFLVDTDPFTRQWYEDNMGTTFAPSLPYPDDPVDSYRTNFGLTKGAKGA